MRTLGTCETMPLTEVDKLWNGDAEQRADAIIMCAACPVLDVCAEIHRDLVSVFGVVAGIDYTRYGATISMGLASGPGTRAREIVVGPVDTKRCPLCALTLPITDFSAKSGARRTRAYCRPCMRIKDRQWKANGRARKEAAA